MKVNFKNRNRSYDLVTQAAESYNKGFKELALSQLYKALQFYPDCEEALFNLCAMEYQVFNFEKSLELGTKYFKVAKKDPVYILASYCADAANRLSQYELGALWAKKFIVACPHETVCYNTLAVCLFKQHYFKAAIKQYDRCLTITPGLEQPLNNLGLLYKAIGDYKKCTEYGLKMAALNRTQADVYKNLLTAYLYYPEVPVEELAKQVDKYIEIFVNKDAKFPEFKLNLNPNRKLRVAIVSSDLYAHPVGRNFLSVYANSDDEHLEFVCYSNSPKEDAITEAYKGKAVKFVTTHGISDIEVARMIRADQCDIAIFLCPFFDANRPLIAAYRAAPVQVSYLDAGRTTIPNMDYLVIGREFAPRTIKDIGVERVFGMPRFYQHPFLPDAPTPNEVPALTNGYITFGIFNNPAKINEKVLELWGEIAKKCNCKFYFKYKGLWRNPELQERVLEHIPKAQCLFEIGDNNYNNHMLAYYNADIQLDTFAFTSSTTAFESLTMGVPVITMRGDTIMSNYCAGILTQSKLKEFIAKNKEEYIELALKYANNPEYLIPYRKNIRDNNVKEYISTVKPYFFVRTLKAFWKKYCKEQSLKGNV